MRKWISNIFGGRQDDAVSTAVKATLSRTPDLSVESLEKRQQFSAVFGLGLNQITSGTLNSTVNLLHNTGTTSVHFYLDVSNYSDRSESGVFKYIRDLHNDGFSTLITVTPAKGLRASYAAVNGYFNWLAGDLGGAADIWEVGNEPDQNGWNMPDYVHDLLDPASAALHAHGEKVCSGGVSWNPDDIKKMVANGMLNDVDYVGYHPYRPTIANLETCLAEIKSVIGSKPLIATEWNTRGFTASNTAGWANSIKQYWPVINSAFYAEYYYASYKSSTMAGAAGLLTSSGSPNEPFYSTYMGLNGGSATIPSTPPTTPVTPPPTTPVTPPSTPTPPPTTPVTPPSTPTPPPTTPVTPPSTPTPPPTTPVTPPSTPTTPPPTTPVTPPSTPTPPPTTPVTPPSTPTTPPSTTGNAPAGTGASISGELWNDTNGNALIDAGENVTGSRTVFIDTNGNGILDAGEVSTTSSASGLYTFTGLKAGTYNITRAFPSGYHLSNSTTKDITVTVANSQVLKNVNIGTTTVITAATPPGTPISPILPITTTAPLITGFEIIDGITGLAIPGYSDVTTSATITLASLKDKQIQIEALSSGAASVKFQFTGRGTVVDSAAPFTAFVNQTTKAVAPWYATTGTYSLTTTGYTAAKGAGTAGKSTTLSLKIV